MRSPIALIGAATACVAALIALLLAFDIDEQVVTLLRWINAQGALQQLWFIPLMAAVVVLLLPGLLFTCGAGFVFGVVQGTAFVVIGTTIGACLAFLIARYVAGGRAAHWLERHEQLRRVNVAIERDDAKVVLLTRLIPFFPGKLSNYVFGLSTVSFRGYTLGTLIGLIPFSLHNVYLGSIAASLMTIDEQGFGRTPLQWAIYLVGFVATVIAVLYLNRLARTALATSTGSSAETSA